MLSSPETTEPNGAHGGTILVLDDDAPLRELFGHLLTALGYHAVCVPEGSQVIVAYEMARARGAPCVAVFLDLHNRFGLGGTATLARLHAIDAQVKAIVCSGDLENPVMTHFQAHGFCAALSKPFGLKELLHVLHRLPRLEDCHATQADGKIEPVSQGT